VASANCGLYCGATVDFVDIDPLTGNMSVAALEKKLVGAEAAGSLPKIVVPVHLAGQSCNMEAIANLGSRYGFKILEDASHAIGGKYKREPVGNCRFSDITVFSFHPVKIITTGEGGMATTNSPDLAKRMARLRTHGITRDPADFVGTADAPSRSASGFGPWYYEQQELGFNYRMTDIEAALGASQMRKVDAFVSRRHELARRYDRMLEDLPLNLPEHDPECYSSLHLYVVRLRLGEISATHKEVFETLRSRGIGVNLHYIPVYRQPYYRDLGFAGGDFPESEKYYSEAISLPIHAGLTEDEQVAVVDALRESVHA
jgi:dTDP-4-amino-4,6-dideoxygalactose transaminase